MMIIWGFNCAMANGPWNPPC